jgi:hypothetical protein
MGALEWAEVPLVALWAEGRPPVRLAPTLTSGQSSEGLQDQPRELVTSFYVAYRVRDGTLPGFAFSALTAFRVAASGCLRGPHPKAEPGPAQRVL